MDDITFDRIARTVSAGWGRRSLLGLLAGAAVGRLTSFSGLDEAEARDKKKGGKKKGNGKKHHKKKKKRDEPKGEPCGDGYCNQTQCCHLGQCVDRFLCCTANSNCNPCSRCEIGLCVPNPDMNGKACNGCLECANGACGIPNAEFCEDDQQCRPNGECCPKCVNDTCCSAREACINPGPFNDNFCCDKVVNQPCGANGDGTYKKCCDLRTEECIDGECVLKCEAGLTAPDLCCPSGEVPCGDDCCDGECCDDECVDLQTHPVHCGACGNACDERTERCFDGQCRDICSLNEPPWQNACDDGVDYWCCPDRSTTCCRLSGAPHCC